MKYFIVFAALIASCFVYAQSNSEPPVRENEESTAPSSEQSSTRSSSEKEPEFDVFKPTEDIAEDLAVPFPADI